MALVGLVMEDGDDDFKPKDVEKIVSEYSSMMEKHFKDAEESKKRNSLSTSYLWKESSKDLVNICYGGNQSILMRVYDFALKKLGVDMPARRAKRLLKKAKKGAGKLKGRLEEIFEHVKEYTGRIKKDKIMAEIFADALIRTYAMEREYCLVIEEVEEEVKTYQEEMRNSQVDPSKKINFIPEKKLDLLTKEKEMIQTDIRMCEFKLKTYYSYIKCNQEVLDSMNQDYAFIARSYNGLTNEIRRLEMGHCPKRLGAISDIMGAA